MSYGPTELFVANFVGIQEELGKLFSAHGLVRDFWVSQKKGARHAAPNSGLFGVVRMATHQDALAAKKALNNTGFNGKTLSVKWATNQRVLWVGNLGPSVTNEALEAAFGQFGPVERCVVAANPETGVSRRYGFTAFEKKEDAARALAMCRTNLFKIGTSPHPVVVDLAWLEDSNEGFTNEMKTLSSKESQAGPAPPMGLPSHFAQAGTAEYALASQLKELRTQYKQAKHRLKAEMEEAVAHLLTHGSGVTSLPSAQTPMLVRSGQPLQSQARGQPQEQPVVALSGQPLGPPQGQPVMVPQPAGTAAVQVARPGSSYTAEEQMDAHPWHRERRRQESFHDVAPPRSLKRRPAPDNYADFRYNPPPGEVPARELAAGQRQANIGGGISKPMSSAFVRGGELHTTEASGESPKADSALPQHLQSLPQAGTGLPMQLPSNPDYGGFESAANGIATHQGYQQPVSIAPQLPASGPHQQQYPTPQTPHAQQYSPPPWSQQTSGHAVPAQQQIASYQTAMSSAQQYPHGGSYVPGYGPPPYGAPVMQPQQEAQPGQPGIFGQSQLGQPAWAGTLQLSQPHYDSFGRPTVAYEGHGGRGQVQDQGYGRGY